MVDKCLKCKNNTKGNNFCDDKCLNRWLLDNFNSFSIVSGYGNNDQGVKCKKCEKKIIETHGKNNEVDDQQIEELIKHLESCSGKSDKSDNKKNKDNRERERKQNRRLCDRCQQDIGKNYQDLGEIGNVNEYYIENNRMGKKYTICPKCYLCSYCKTEKIQTITNEDNEEWIVDVWLCRNCAENATPRLEHQKQKKDKPNKKIPNRIPNNLIEHSFKNLKCGDWETTKKQARDEGKYFQGDILTQGTRIFDKNKREIAKYNNDDIIGKGCDKCRKLVWQKNMWGDEWVAENHQLEEVSGRIIHLTGQSNFTPPPNFFIFNYSPKCPTIYYWQ